MTHKSPVPSSGARGSRAQEHTVGNRGGGRISDVTRLMWGVGCLSSVGLFWPSVPLFTSALQRSP